MNIRKLFFLLTLFFATSCGKENAISDELIGDWMYERESLSLVVSVFEDNSGIITFNADNTGLWNQNIGLEWKLQSNNDQIEISKSLLQIPSQYPLRTLYELTRENEDKFILTHHITKPVEYFENITLTRIK